MFSSTVSDGDDILYTQYNNLRLDMIQVGSIILFAGSSTPTNFLECDGSSVDTTTYAELFSITGYTYGGSGASFNIPDMQDKFPIGVNTFLLGATGGGSVTLAVGNIPSHSHTIPSQAAHQHFVTAYDVGATANKIGYDNNKDDSYTSSSAGAHDHGAATGNTGQASPTAVTVLPSYLSMRYIICYTVQATIAQRDTYITSQYNLLRNNALMIGGITMFGATGGFPSHTLECDGSSISTATYADLFAILGYTYGGAGASFNLPDTRDRFVIGKSSTYALGATGGGSVTLVDNNMPQHGHTINNQAAHTHFIPYGESTFSPSDECFGNDFVTTPVTYAFDTQGAHDHGGATNNEGSATAVTILPSYLSLVYIIRY